ncbi:hypothetical protein Glove_567g21 [Diversispora epigaea]|uniref:Crinkler effector protein N-terminal domain-containing protein n=1 Tax=Diversispora epigaea TaxID=1348612 RepID=A0A397GDR7_9GLOM|nr:hypothetical protein Glove_567g21 [Diversispora epigaea]
MLPDIAEIMVFCLVLGDVIGDGFPIEISSDISIGYLKELVKEKIKPRFDSIPANILRLWKVYISTNDKDMNTKIQAENIKEQLEGVELIPYKTVGEYFNELPINYDIRIIIQAPTIGKKEPEKHKKSGNRVQTYPIESEEGRDSLAVMLPERLNVIIEFLENNDISLLRSPPSSGKSTLGQFLAEYYGNRNYNSIYISLAGITGTQETVKELLSYDGRNKNLKMFLLGTYHPTLSDQLTLIPFSKTLSLNHLLLKQKEFQQLVSNYVQLHFAQGSPLFNVPDDVQNAIFNLTGGHPGLCRFILQQLRIHYRESSVTVKTVDMLRYLASSHLRNSITESSRAFHWIHKWNPTNEESAFVRNVLLKSQSRAPFSIDYGSNPAARNFMETGIFAKVDDQIQFTAPSRELF